MMRATHQVGAMTGLFMLAAVASGAGPAGTRLAVRLGPFAADLGPVVDLPRLVGLPAVTPALGAKVALACVVAALIGGIAPDFDKPRALWQRAILMPLAQGHRHLSHSLVGLALFAIVTALALGPLGRALHLPLAPIWLAAVAGYLTHLLLDSLTVEGVPWLYPLPWYFGFPPFRSIRIRTGSLVEEFVVLPGLLIASGLVWYTAGVRILQWVR
jgi:membrane-bound metal-dependent hydrolase YbcI (DUF457 family)